jgi:hypothetical protein
MTVKAEARPGLPMPLAASVTTKTESLQHGPGMTLTIPPSDPQKEQREAALEAECVSIVSSNRDIGLAVSPRDALVQAHVAAKALQEVINSKKDRVIVNGKTYLTFEDWQTIAHFYGLSVRVVNSTPLAPYSDPEYGIVRGYEARAEVVNVRTGIAVGAADGMCSSDEKRWGDKPLYALRSMAQTRACAKALRNILAFVPVIAGYEPTPSEEITSDIVGAGE